MTLRCFACARTFPGHLMFILHALVPRRHWKWHWYSKREEP
ncbi:MAG TPA: hypothetical protein VMG14_01380 [Thermoplasmata archaeon]|nr:hypothetical protein [Thermoplasmata archaeon]HTW76404.1 hypothetical protein [Thermoplasmata archaeon]